MARSLTDAAGGSGKPCSLSLPDDRHPDRPDDGGLPSATLYRFADFRVPVAVSNCDGLWPVFRRLAPSWPVAPWDGPTGIPPAISVFQRDGRHHIRSESGETKSYGRLAYLVCALFVDLMLAYGRDHAQLSMLHAGAVRIGGRLIAFPARGKTGKSTLTVQLARRGADVWSDDVLPVDLASGDAIALGITPRVRLPLPDLLPAADRDWIRPRIAVGADKFGYVGLGDRLQPLGTRAPIAAFIQLVREQGAEPALGPGRRADLLRLLIRQNFGGPESATCLLSGAARLVETLPCYRITHPGGDHAVDMIHRILEELP